MPNVFGNAVGNSIVGQIQETAAEKQQNADFEKQIKQQTIALARQTFGVQPNALDAASAYSFGPLASEPNLAHAPDSPPSSISASSGPDSPPVGVSEPSGPEPYIVSRGERYASIARDYYGDERLASLIMASNKVSPTYQNIHGLQACA